VGVLAIMSSFKGQTKNAKNVKARKLSLVGLALLKSTWVLWSRLQKKIPRPSNNTTTKH